MVMNMSGKFFHKQRPTNIHRCFLQRLKKRLCFLQWHISKKKDGNLMWCNYFTEYIKQKLMIPISQVTNPELSTKKEEVTNPKKMENNELVEER